MSNKSTLCILVIVLVVAFILLSLTSSNSYTPYNKQQMYATYEPLSEISEMTENPEMTEISEMTEPTMKTDKKNTRAVSEPINNDMQTENFEPIIDVPQTIQYGPFRDSALIDKFSQITTNGMDGVNGCVSSGLSNAGGYMCLSPELIQLLKTRGGNAAGGECLSK